MLAARSKRFIENESGAGRNGRGRKKGRGLADGGAANDVVALINEIRGDGSSLLRVH